MVTQNKRKQTICVYGFHCDEPRTHEEKSIWTVDNRFMVRMCIAINMSYTACHLFCVHTFYKMCFCWRKLQIGYNGECKKTTNKQCNTKTMGVKRRTKSRCICLICMYVRMNIFVWLLILLTFDTWRSYRIF